MPRVTRSERAPLPQRLEVLYREAVAGLRPEDGRPDDPAADQWLASRGITAAVRFTVERFGSDSAPEGRAALGQIVKTVRR
ncbi:hypothetical protein GCM10023322_75750 [Rugosimonospora acidiphila]|uniref:Uncharacterized protein n=1 Tax=Rugosimonospora acidiphila TaxID=556531 RepID=A0ABP9SQY5_9ACTN